MKHVVELPALVKVDMSETSFRKAVQQNFDHLAQAFKVTLGQVETAAQDTDLIVETIHNTDTEGFDADLRQTLIEAGVGAEDGAPPSTPPTGLRAVGGIGDWISVHWTGVVNGSPVTYNVYVSTASGFAPAANNFAGSFTVPGGEKLGTYHLAQFPSTHFLGATKPVQGTTYYIKIRAADADGEGPESAQVSASPLEVNADSIIAAGTIVGNLIAGATITGANIAGQTITGEKISGGTIDAITITSATINSGTLNSLNIFSSNIFSPNFYTDTFLTNPHIRIVNANKERISWHSGSGETARISTEAGAGLLRIQVFNGGINIVDVIDTSIRTAGLQVGTRTSEPTIAGYGKLYKNGNDIMWEAHGAAAVKLNP